jgi:hypothetical protein
MSEDDDYSRRRLLKAIGVTGTLGAGGGAATGAYLSDWEPFSGNLIGTGDLILELATDRATDVKSLDSFSDDDYRTDATIEVGFSGIKPRDTGVLRVGHRLGEDRGRIWMRAASSSATDLGSYIDVELLQRPTCDDGEGTELYQGTLDGLTTRYADGGLLTDGCVDGRWCLDLKWTFRADTPADLSEESLSCSFDFTAVQCRHSQQNDNPWNETE